MQKFHIILYIIVPLILTGCSSVYTVKDYSSKEEFYSTFNDFALDKNVKVRLINDSLCSGIGAIIENDTLYSLGRVLDNYRLIVPISDIKDIDYNRINSQKGTVLLKNGAKFSAEKMRSHQDSLEFYTTLNISGKYFITSIDKVKEVWYNNHWGNIGTKILAGTVVGIIGGFTIGTAVDDHAYYQEQGEYSFRGCILGVPTGALMGLIVGWYTGYNYIYRFNP